MKKYLAIDIGASSGRHIVGFIKGGQLVTEEVHRFPNGMDTLDGHLVWDTERLFSEIKAGIKKAIAAFGEIESLSIDTWGVDYVLMRGDEEILPVYAYRDGRTEAPIKEVHSIIPFEELYVHTGIQFNTFNTIYQLYADKLAGRLDEATDFLLLPDYFIYKLTGKRCKEFTEATTTGLVNCESLELDREIWQRLGFPERLLTSLDLPGTVVGRLTDEVAAEVGGNLNVVLCGSHDTASAIEAIDMETNAPYISSGTWSLLGVKTERAINDEGSRLADYSNEGGVGCNCYQKNITGMWLIQSLRAELCPDMSYSDIAELARGSSYTETFNVNDPAFMAPESMTAAIREYLVAAGKVAPAVDADYFNSAYLSLGESYNEAIRDLERNTGRTYSEIYIVGGGAKNTYLNEITERVTGKRVHALPIEATAIGNLKVQMSIE